MAISYAAGVRTGRMTAVRLAIDAGGAAGKLKLYTAADVLLATLTLSYECGEVVGDALTFFAIGADTAADATGTATKATITDSNDVVVVSGLTVGSSSADVILPAPSLKAGELVGATTAVINHAVASSPRAFTVVGVGSYNTFAEAHTAASDGDTITVEPATYDLAYTEAGWTISKNITLKSAVTGARFVLNRHVDATMNVYSSVAPNVIVNSELRAATWPGASRHVVVIEDMELRLDPDDHVATQYPFAGESKLLYLVPRYNVLSTPGQHDVTLRRCYFHHCGSAIAGQAEHQYVWANSTLTVENSIFEYLGNAAVPNNHHIYAGAKRMTFTGCAFRGRNYPETTLPPNTATDTSCPTGHMVKSTAHELIVKGCRFTTEDYGTNSPPIECWGGGKLVVEDSYFEMGRYSDSMDSLIRYGQGYTQAYGQLHLDSGSGNSVSISRNTFVNHSAGSPFSSGSGYIKATYAGYYTLPSGWSPTLAIAVGIQYNVFAGPGIYPTNVASQIIGAPHTLNADGALTILNDDTARISGWGMVTPLQGVTPPEAVEYVDYTNALTGYPSTRARTDAAYGAAPATFGLPSWRSVLAANTLTDITPAGHTSNTAYIAAGYNVEGWRGDLSTGGGAILSGWGAGCHAPDLGNYGAIICGSNGHETEPTSTLHRFDLETARWVEPIGPPQIHRQVTPTFAAPPTDAACWYDPTNYGGYPSFTWAGLAASGYPTKTTPYHISSGPSGGYTFKEYPCPYGARYNTNVSAGMRYDQFNVQPASCGGEADGTLIIYAPGLNHDLAEAVGDWHTWRFGLTSRTWLPVSSNVPDVDYAANGFAAPTAFSEDYSKVVATRWSKANVGTYDPLTNAHGMASWYVGTYGAYANEGCGVITHGHSAHLFLFSAQAQGSNEYCLGCLDLDKALATPAVETYSYAIQNKNSTNSANVYRLKLLNPSLVFSISNWSMAWSRDRQKLLIWQPPNVIVSTSPLPTNLLYAITIPSGSTGGVPNWQTQDWVVESIPLTLTSGTAGVHTGAVPQGYKRFAWSDALDCAIWVPSPSDKPVQAIRVW